MTNAILIHGTCDKEEYFNAAEPSLSNAHWFPWLQKNLLVNEIFTQTPEMPDAYKPDFIKWRKEFERYDVNEDTVLVGHSCGGGFLLRWLSENKIKIKKLILVAPWLDPDRIKTKNFFEFEIDPEVAIRAEEAHLLISADDGKDIQDSLKIILEKIPDLKIHRFEDMGHFCKDDMNTEEFPFLLNLILDNI